MNLESTLLVALSQGFIGSLHCITMCGPFIFILNSGAKSNKAKGIFLSLIYNFSRALSYMIIGSIIGFFGKTLNQQTQVTQLASYLGALMIFLFALPYLIDSLPFKLTLSTSKTSARITRMMGKLVKKFHNKPIISYFIFGIFSGLLPCGLLIPVYSLSLTRGEALQGSLVMAAFAIGTIPTLMLLSLFSLQLKSVIQQLLSSKVWKFSFGLLLITIGIATILVRNQHEHNKHINHQQIKSHNAK